MKIKTIQTDHHGVIWERHPTLAKICRFADETAFVLGALLFGAFEMAKVVGIIGGILYLMSK